MQALAAAVEQLRGGADACARVHLAEVHAGARLRVTTQLLDGSGKRMHLLNRLYDGAGQLLATAEHLLLHVSLETRRASPPGPALQQKLAD
ncbi:MAG: thioesterase family protein, partial [Gammaproteobacteria bacterium]